MKRITSITGSSLLTTGLLLMISGCSGKSKVEFNTVAAAQGTVEQSVMATGYIQPVEQVEVGTQVSGIIEEIYVDFNSVVEVGQKLARLETATLDEKVAQARFNVRSAESNLNLANQTYNRTQRLHEADAATKVALEEAENSRAQAQTQLDNANATLRQAIVDLGYATIVSPINGVVLDRAVAIGQTVASSFNTPTLFTIAEDLTKMQVEADVDEADIGVVKEGQPVKFTVDAFNDDVFTGQVSQVRLNPTVTNNVVTYTVIVEAPNPDEKLFPGMTANITITTSKDEGIIVPASALTFRMTEEYAAAAGLPEPPAMQQPGPGGAPGSAVWVRTAAGFERRQVQTGMNDGVEVVIKSGLSAGEEVIVSASTGKKVNNGQAASNPLMPSPPRRR